MKWELVRAARSMGVSCRPEVYGLFAACIPQAGRAGFDTLPMRKRQGLVPDLSMLLQWRGVGPERQLLFEFKTLHHGSSTYQASEQRCRAVARRAEALPAEYARKAAKVDHDYCGTARGKVGPVSARLRTFDPVYDLVFGSRGEASQDVHQLITALASAGACRLHDRSNDEGLAAIRSKLAWLLKRQLAISAVRCCARITLARLEMVGRVAYAASSRWVAADIAVARAR